MPNACSWNAQFVYDSNDSVFFWHPDREEFCLLYNFGAQEGDSWTVYHIGDVGGQPDSSVLYVDSVDTEIVSGNQLKVVYTTRLNSVENWWGVGGKIIERVGGLYLFPTIGVCDPLPGELRCYRDSVISVTQGVYNCDDVISSIWNDDQNDLVIYPNPTQGITTIVSDNFKAKDVMIRAYDEKGSFVFERKIDSLDGEIRLNMSNLDNGNYLCEIQIENNIYTAKILLVK